jgi:hypothetical protein
LWRQKEPKTLLSRRLLAAQAFPPQTRQNQGYAYFAGLPLRFEIWHAKTLMPCHAHGHHCFAWFRAKLIC